MRDFLPARVYYPDKQENTVTILGHLLSLIVCVVIVAVLSRAFVDAVDRIQQGDEQETANQASVVATWTH